MFGKSIIAFAPIDVVGSHMAPEAFTGQNGGLNPSSIKIGEKIPRSTVAKSIIAADGSVSAAPGSWQTRTVNAAKIKTTPGMKSPDNSAKVPTSLNRGTVAPSVIPAKRGNAKR